MLKIRQFITDICGSLLDIQTTDETVRFAHAASVQYLDSTASGGEPLPDEPEKFPLLLTKRAPSLFAACLIYLTYDDIDFIQLDKSTTLYTRKLDTHLRRFPFLRYATLELWTHFDPDEEHVARSREKIDIALSRFFRDGSILVKWLQLYSF